MKTRITFVIILLVNWYIYSQSSMVFDSGTHIEVTGSADICADVVTINGSYSGDGTLCNGPLPVELVLFTANVNNWEVVLNWKTATELNNYGFEIERRSHTSTSLGVTNWEKIGFVKGSGNSTTPKEYSFVDNIVKGGKISYRLKQIDNDGSFSYSPEIEVEVKVPKEFSLKQNYPNPFNPLTTISFTLEEPGLTTLKIYNELGEEVMTLINNEYLEASEYHKQEFDGSRLASGMYIAKLQSGNKVQTKKMLLVK